MRQRRRTLRACVGVACLAAALPARLAAQMSQGTVEIGAARLRQRDVPRTDAATAGLTLRRDAARYALAAAGALTLADGDRSTTQGLLAASLLGRAGGRTRWEIGGAVTVFDQGDLPASAGAYLIAREHLAIGRFGGWVGVGFGGIEEFNWWSPTRSAELATWYASRVARFTAAAVLVDTRSEPYGPVTQRVTDPVTYTDGSISARWVVGRRVDVDARAGVRLISRGALSATGRGTRPFAAVDAAVWVTPRVALVAAIGRQLSDLSRGTPDTRFAAVALRFTVRDPARVPPPARRPAVITKPRLALVSDTSGQSRVVVTASRAALVELAATFTSWEPVALVRRGDQWELDRPIPSGAHRVLVRVDGGPWVVPENLPAAADDFGGAVGIVTVP
ncbi:MAG: glycogen-binding domain-containing protein [Gemmatimonadaceae bacterium]